MAGLGRRTFLANFALSIIGGQLVSGAASAQSVCNGTTGHFTGETVTQWLPDGRGMKLEKAVTYVDACSEPWTASLGAVVDGASIPRILWSLIGGPFEGKYRNASIVHDWYCAVRTRTADKTHRMFYEAMIDSGVPMVQAKMMYFGVCLAGPRWDDMTIANNQLVSQGGRKRSRNVAGAKILKVIEGPNANGSFASRVSATKLDGASPDAIAQRAAFSRKRLVERTRGPATDAIYSEEEYHDLIG
jgi:hypothetical protein